MRGPRRTARLDSPSSRNAALREWRNPVDAPDLGSGARKGVGVQIPPLAQSLACRVLSLWTRQAVRTRQQAWLIRDTLLGYVTVIDFTGEKPLVALSEVRCNLDRNE
jgi:hypothetical protein